MSKKGIYLLLLTIVSVLSLSVGCSKFSPKMLEEKPFTDKINPFYYPKTIDSPAEIFSIDEAFRKNPISKKDRTNYAQYSKIYFDEEFFPLKIENYKRDSFNNHIYYPYLTYKLEKKENKISVSTTEKTWQNNQLISSSVKVSFFDREKEASIDRVLEAYVRDANSSPFLNSILKFEFVADDSEENKRIQTQVAADSVYIKLTGKSPLNPKIKINVLFYDQNRQEATGIPVGQPIKMKVSLSRTSLEEGLNFTYISADLSAQQREEIDKAMKEQQGNNMYRSKTNE